MSSTVGNIEVKETLRARGICVVIPTYNNDGTIEQVVRETLNMCYDVIVVNDGSTDKTGFLLQKIDGITLISYDKNRGKGYALKKAFKHALKQGFAYAITLDGDGQHSPDDIPRLLKANRAEAGTLIVGQRDLDGVERSFGNRFANNFSNFWFWIQTGHWIDDTQTGYRLYPLKKLKYLSLMPSRYEAELAMMVFASWHGVKIKVAPINVYYPPRGERVSHFRPAIDFARISVLNTVLCLLAVIYGLPLRLIRGLWKVGRTAYALLFFIIFSLFIITPCVWIYVKLSRNTEKRKKRLHSLIYKFSRFVTRQHGIPGAKFKTSVANENCFDTPHVIICNHQSHLDLACLLQFSPKIIFLTNDWVWKNPFYGVIIRNADFLNVSQGVERLMPKLHTLVKQGYSIAVFPEGTRSETCEIARFHRGAFVLGEELGVDVLPIYLYGAGKVLPKKSHMLHSSPIYVEVGDPITREELDAMGDTRAQASCLRKQYIAKYNDIANKIEQDV
ncbi:MAG: glycosyltransferase [Muribaculaceae bacterium]|nr:glycosyltransferase [Muribaculaceae bacterium]